MFLDSVCKYFIEFFEPMFEADKACKPDEKAKSQVKMAVICAVVP